MKKTLLFLFLSFTVLAQNNYPQGYFIIPIANTPQVSLSGAFGDIRINHFHSGLDMRTGGVEGKRILAAADGYVSRIRVQLGGYGNVLYITHPNGLTTVYAHLKEFNTELQKYLTEQQYLQKTWEIDVEVPEGLFTYKQGEFVAFSGNTGGSGGPHLHFEIRDEDENTLDPRLFGFKGIRDNLPPLIDLISIKTTSEDALVNGKFGAFDFRPRRSGANYTLPNIRAKGEIGIEILTYDKMANSPFRLGVHEIELFMNGESQYKYKLEKMSFHNKQDMNVHVNYERQIQNNLRMHKAYVEEANSFDFYESNQDWGKLKITEPRNQISIKIKDSHQNTSTLNFVIVQDNSTYNSEKSASTKVEVLDNFIKVVSPTQAEGLVIHTKSGSQTTIPAQKSSLGTWSAVYNLDNGFPTAVYWGQNEVKLPVNTALLLNNPKIDLPTVKADLSGVLYNDTYINLDTNNDKLIIHKDVIPLKGHFNVKWTKQGEIKFQEKQKVYLEGGRKPKFIGGTWENNTINFRTREFGTYVTLYDFDPPKITPLVVNKNNLKFKISDNLSGIKKIECYVNNEWVLMDYEYKTGDIWSRKLDPDKPFNGKVVLKVTDNCNNTQSYESNIL